MHKWLPEVNKHPQATRRGSDRRGSGRGRVCSLLWILCGGSEDYYIYPIYPLLFAFQPENSLEASCLQTLLVWARGWGEHCFVLFREAIYERAYTSNSHYTTGAQITLQFPIHCCDVTKLPYLSVANSKRLFLYTVCCRRGCQCFSVISTRNQTS